MKKETLHALAELTPMQPTRRPSLINRLRWSYILVSAIPLLLLGILLLNNSYESRRQSFYDDQQTAANWIGRAVSQEIVAMDEHLLNLSQQLLIQQSDASLLNTVQEFLRDTPVINQLSILNAGGRERIRVSRLRTYFPSELTNRGTEPLVQKALGGTLARSAITINGNTASYQLCVPLDNGIGMTNGAACAEINAAPIQAILDQTVLKQGTYAYLVDPAGTVMISGLKPPDTSSFRVRHNGAGPTVSSDAGLQEYRTTDGIAVIGAWMRAAPADWWVVVEVPQRLAYGPLLRGMLILSLLSVLVVIVAVGFGLYQAREVVRPIIALREGAIIIGNGDLSHRISVESHDELGDLADEFNRMAEHLQESRNRIEHQNERLRRGLALARDIQTGLLPAQAPWSADQVAVHAISHPAYEVGGDFYTYAALNEGRVAITIGDISGKGVGAALLMALTASATESQARQAEYPGQMLAALNRQLAPRLKANNMNAALLHAVIDFGQRTLRVANAGMIAPLLIRKGTVSYIEAYGLPLGSIPEARYPDVEIALLPGDTVLMLSDGVVEARNASGELFGFERLEALLTLCLGHERPEQVVDMVLTQVQQFMDGAEQPDDITIIVIQPQLSAVATSKESLVQPEEVVR